MGAFTETACVLSEALTRFGVMPREIKRLSRGPRGVGREGRHIPNRAVTVGLGTKAKLGKCRTGHTDRIGGAMEETRPAKCVEPRLESRRMKAGGGRHCPEVREQLMKGQGSEEGQEAE